jgi:ribonucleoside-diphosphate reductase alpha chain
MEHCLEEMKVNKRSGLQEDVSFDKIANRLKKLANIEPSLIIIFSKLVIKVIDQLYTGISTKEIDELTAQQCASMATQSHDYSILASRIVISNHHKNTESSFYNVMKKLYEFKDVNNNHVPLISTTAWDITSKYKEELDSLLDFNRDYYIDYFGFKTLERAYLMKINKVIVERPQHMWLRVAIGIHGDNFDAIQETYFYLSNKYFTHATPTLFNAGTPRPQLSSCYLLAMEKDSIEGIYDTLKDCGKISKWAGGIGLHIHNIRASGSHIRGTNGHSNGIVPMLRVFNATARYIDQGGGRRNGSFAIYLEPWHADIFAFLDLKKNHGDEEMRARDLFYALWMPDLFMKCVIEDKEWHLFCPDRTPGLSDVYGDEFEVLYNKYVESGLFLKKIKARELWFAILDSQMETGTPYLLYKDSANRKSNQQNLGTIKSSNLCCEIMEYSNEKETAVCNLASIALNKFVTDEKLFDFDNLHKVTKLVTNNLNKIIDVNFYPTEKTRRSNLLHRPIGIGVQGLADVFMLMDIPFYSKEAKELNKMIFETIYHAALEKSMELSRDRYEGIETLRISAKNKEWFFTDITDNACNTYTTDVQQNDELNNLLKNIKPIMGEILRPSASFLGSYSTFEGSPASKGVLQFDMWGVEPNKRYNWNTLKNDIIQYGLRNSLLVAPMPTASTSQILGNNECFEPFTSNIYTRRTLAGEFIMVNKYLIKELTDLGIWSEKVKNNIIENKGSVQYIENVSYNIKEKYRTVWEIPMKHIIDMAKDRGAFICQSQSLNLWMEDPNYKILTSMHIYAWQAGLKTGLYYLRRKPKHQPQQFTIEPGANDDGDGDDGDNAEDSDDEPCEMCSG